MSEESCDTPEMSPKELLKRLPPLTYEQWIEGARKELNGHEHADINYVWERVLNHISGLCLTVDLWMLGWTDDEKSCVMPLITYTSHKPTGLTIVISHDDEKNVWRSKLVEGEEVRLHLNS